MLGEADLCSSHDRHLVVTVGGMLSEYKHCHSQHSCSAFLARFGEIGFASKKVSTNVVVKVRTHEDHRQRD